MDESALDREFLTELLDGDKEFAEELFEVYIESSSQCLDDILSSFKTSQREKSIRSFHTLKGASGSVGLVKVQSFASELEALAKSGELEVCEARLPELKELVGQTKSILNAYLEEL